MAHEVCILAFAEHRGMNLGRDHRTHLAQLREIEYVVLADAINVAVASVGRIESGAAKPPHMAVGIRDEWRRLIGYKG
jgi:hypothetical protein